MGTCCLETDQTERHQRSTSLGLNQHRAGGDTARLTRVKVAQGARALPEANCLHPRHSAATFLSLCQSVAFSDFKPDNFKGDVKLIDMGACAGSMDQGPKRQSKNRFEIDGSRRIADESVIDSAVPSSRMGYGLDPRANSFDR